MDDATNGRFAAIEYLLGQLFYLSVDTEDDPQDWVETNLNDITQKIRRSKRFSVTEKAEAIATVERVMQTTSRAFAAVGRGEPLEFDQ